MNSFIYFPLGKDRTLRLHPLALTVLSGILLSVGCNESNFSSSNGNKSDPPPKSNEIDEPPAELPPTDECVEGDKVNIKWVGPIKECIIDQGKSYNFESQTCTEMRQAEWECTWDNIKAEMKERGLSSSVLEKDSETGAKLVTCGQSKDGNRIVAQWARQPEGGFDCNASSKLPKIITGCYTLYKGEVPPAPETEEEQRKQVFDCMNSL